MGMYTHTVGYPPPLTHTPAQKHHDGVSLGRNEPQNKDVTTATVVALQDRLPQWAFLVEGDLFALGPHQVVDDVTVGREQQ